MSVKEAQIISLLEQGLDFFGQGMLGEARQVWTEVLELDPANEQAREYLRYLGLEVTAQIPSKPAAPDPAFATTLPPTGWDPKAEPFPAQNVQPASSKPKASQAWEIDELDLPMESSYNTLPPEDAFASAWAGPEENLSPALMAPPEPLSPSPPAPSAPTEPEADETLRPGFTNKTLEKVRVRQTAQEAGVMTSKLQTVGYSLGPGDLPQQAKEPPAPKAPSELLPPSMGDPAFLSTLGPTHLPELELALQSEIGSFRPIEEDLSSGDDSAVMTTHFPSELGHDFVPSVPPPPADFPEDFPADFPDSIPTTIVPAQEFDPDFSTTIAPAQEFDPNFVPSVSPPPSDFPTMLNPPEALQHSAEPVMFDPADLPPFSPDDELTDDFSTMIAPVPNYVPSVPPPPADFPADFPEDFPADFPDSIPTTIVPAQEFDPDFSTTIAPAQEFDPNFVPSVSPPPSDFPTMLNPPEALLQGRERNEPPPAASRRAHSVASDAMADFARSFAPPSSPAPSDFPTMLNPPEALQQGPEPTMLNPPERPISANDFSTMLNPPDMPDLPPLPMDPLGLDSTLPPMALDSTLGPMDLPDFGEESFLTTDFQKAQSPASDLKRTRPPASKAPQDAIAFDETFVLGQESSPARRKPSPTQAYHSPNVSDQSGEEDIAFDETFVASELPPSLRPKPSPTEAYHSPTMLEPSQAEDEPTGLMPPSSSNNQAIPKFKPASAPSSPQISAPTFLSPPSQFEQKSHTLEEDLEAKPSLRYGGQSKPKKKATSFPGQIATPHEATASIPAPRPVQKPKKPANENHLLLSGAEDLLGIDDPDGALELVELVLQSEPNNPKAQRLRKECQQILSQQVKSQIHNLDAQPRLLCSPQELSKQRLDHRAGFVISQLDGETSINDLTLITGFDEDDLLHILTQLLNKNLIAL